MFFLERDFTLINQPSQVELQGLDLPGDGGMVLSLIRIILIDR